MVCAAVTALMLYLAGMQVKYLGYGLLASMPVLYYLLFRVPWRRARMLAFINPEADPRGSGFHILQSLIAVGTGGLRGLGLMEGRQKLFYLPEPHTDFIYANVCEELGLIGALLGDCAVCCSWISRVAGGLSFDRSVCSVPCVWHYFDRADPGVLQHECCGCAGPDEGNYAAVYLLWRDVAVCDAGEYGRSTECDSRDRLRWRQI